jgi:hypothetical protein
MLLDSSGEVSEAPGPSVRESVSHIDVASIP